MKSRITFMGLFLGVVAAVAVAADKPAAKPTPVSADAFSIACSNAWLCGMTTADATAFGVGEEIAFTVSLQSVTNKVPEGAYGFRWKRTGSDGVTEEGTAPLTAKKSFVQKLKMEKPGAIRLDVDLVTKDGKSFEKTVGTGKAQKKYPIKFAGGAIVGAKELRPEAEPKEFAAYFKALKKRLVRANFKNIARTPVEIKGVKDVTGFTVELPSVTAHPLKGLLLVPTGALARPMPVRLQFSACGYDKPVPLPAASAVKADEVVFTLAYAAGKPEERNEAFCAELYLDVARTLEYVKSLPEWNGRTILAGGWGFGALMAVWAAAADPAVTELNLSCLPSGDFGFFRPSLQARHVAKDCRVLVPFAGLGDTPETIVATAEFYHALPGERVFTWKQGSNSAVAMPAAKGRDVTWEKLNPVSFVRMDAEHARVEQGIPKPFANIEEQFADKAVGEILLDPDKPEGEFLKSLSSTLTYAKRDLVPLEIYISLPCKKLKEKAWLEFRERERKLQNTIPCPVYVNAGIDLPPPDAYPWFRVVDGEGVLRYSGKSADQFVSALRRAASALGKADPLFAFAKPDLYKEMVEKMVKAKTPLPKIYKAIEADRRKYLKTNPARADEAGRLLQGMRQAIERRAQALTKLYSERPGMAALRFKELLAEWPEAASHPLVLAAQRRIAANPEMEKLAKMEKDLLYINSWHPIKSSDVKKKDAFAAAFRKKVERLTKSPDAAIQGEALLMQAELDNPPQPEPEQVQEN